MDVDDFETHEPEEWWQMLSLFILPNHRGKGLANNLCREALNYLKICRQQPPSVHVRLMVKPENHATVRLYQQLGFVHVGNCTLVEALVANGDAGFLTRDISGEKYSARNGLVMICCLSRS